MKKLFALLAFLPLFSNAQIITTFAGSVVNSYGGDGGSATAGIMSAPSSIAVDAAGNAYIADQGNNRIRKVSASGIITTIAGNSTPSYSGDGGPASASGSWGPVGLALDGAGNLFIADRMNSVIRKINTSGIITTVAGNGTAYFSGDSGPATDGTLNEPSGVSVDAAGNIYIADQGNGRIRKVSAGGIISTVAGDGASLFGGDGGMATAAQLHNPASVALDISGNIYIADELNARIRKINTSGVITTIAGNGTLGFAGDGGVATVAELYQPSGVIVDAAGNVYVADQANNRLRKINTSGIITTIGGNSAGGFAGDGGPATDALLYSPAGITLDAAGNIFFADENNNRIRKINTSGAISTIAGSGIGGYGDGGPATAAELREPDDMVFDVAGNTYICDSRHNLIRKINSSGIISTIAGNGIAAFAGDGGPATAASLSDPVAIAIDNVGNIYFCDGDNARIRKINTAGIITTVAGIGVGHAGDGGPATAALMVDPGGIAIDLAGNIYFSDANAYIRKINTAGIITTVAGNGSYGYGGDGIPATASPLISAAWVAVDNAGNFYFSEEAGHRIRKVDASGIISTIAGDGTIGSGGDGWPATGATLSYPCGISIDNAGNIFVSEYVGNRVRKIDAAGMISTVAGTGALGYTGDGGPATAAELSNPVNARSDNMGHLYIADQDNHAVRKLTGLPVTPFYLATINGVDTLCLGASAVLSDSTAFGAWSSGSTGIATIGTDGTVTGISTGSTTITYTDGGTYTTTPIYVISCPTETQTLPEQNKIVLYPNPATTQLTILSTGKPINQIAISNLVGQTVFAGHYNTSRAEINVSDLPTGVYFVKINNAELRKFVKE